MQRQHRDINSINAVVREATARLSTPGMTPRKWRLVRAFETAAAFLLRAVPSPQGLEGSQTRPDSILGGRVLEFGRHRHPCAVP